MIPRMYFFFCSVQIMTFQRDDMCETFTYWEDGTPNPKLCVHNYGETSHKRPIERQWLGPDGKSGILEYTADVKNGSPKRIYTSGPKFCGPNKPIIVNDDGYYRRRWQ